MTETPPAPVGTAPDETLYFLHVPKAAGSTMRNILRNVYTDERMRIFRGKPEDYREIAELSQEDWSGFDVLAGHFSYGIHRHAPTEPRYFTMLRDPIDQAVSLFYFARSDPRHWLHERLAAVGSIAEFIETHRPRVANDITVRMLAGEDHGNPDFGAVTPEMLEAAKRRLSDEFAAFGLVERFEESVELLGRELRWPRVRYKRRNVTDGRPGVEELAQADRRALLDANRLDTELYEFAVALFEQRAADLAGVETR